MGGSAGRPSLSSATIVAGLRFSDTAPSGLGARERTCASGNPDASRRCRWPIPLASEDRASWPGLASNRAQPVVRRMEQAIASTTPSTGSCSQKRATTHPARARVSLTTRSRITLRASFSDQ
jgi:hypothetical protein